MDLAASPRGWNRPIRPVALVLVGGAVLLIWLGLMVGTVLYFYEHWEARLSLNEHPVRLRLPEGLEALAEVSSPIRSRLSLQPELRLPLRQSIQAQLSDHVQAKVTLHTTLPVNTSVTIDQVVPVKTTLSMSVALRSWLPRIPVTLPVTLDLPLKMTVPIKADIPVDLDVVASANLPPMLNIPVDQVFTLRPQIKADIEASLLSRTAFALVSPLAPFDVVIAHADLRVPFDLTLLKQRQR